MQPQRDIIKISIQHLLLFNEEKIILSEEMYTNFNTTSVIVQLEKLKN